MKKMKGYENVTIEYVINDKWKRNNTIMLKKLDMENIKSRGNQKYNEELMNET